ncbi:glycosyltransferase [bacterium]|nr:glycosyltransferase [bacterium]
MDNHVKVSVILPVYNVEQYLPKCLASVVQQTLKDIEIICVNDGSTDNCLKILEDFKSKDNRIKIINKQNAGLGNARNTGLEEAKGEYISFIDSDDYIDENFLELLYTEATENDADVACGGIKRENDGKTHFLINYSQTVITDDVYQKINVSKATQFSFVWNKIYKHSFLKENELKFMPDVNFEDLVYTPQIMLKSNVLVTVPNTFYHYIKREKSIFQDTENIDLQKDKLFSLKFMCEYYKNAGIDFNKIPPLLETYKIVKDKVIEEPKPEKTEKIERVKLENLYKISVIIPVYNSEKYIAQCLDSILNQSLKDMEIICVNDGSTDASLDILNEYALKDKRIKVISQTNTGNGAGSARNRGIENAKGEYISFIDSDDYIEKDYLQKMYETAKEYDADVACSGVKKERGNEQKIQLKFNEIRVSDNPNDNLKVSKSLPYPYPWNKIYKREFIVSYGIKYVENIYFEDLIFTPFVITKAEKLISVPDVFYHYVERKNSVATTNSNINDSDKQKAFNMGKKYYLEVGINI